MSNGNDRENEDEVRFSVPRTISLKDIAMILGLISTALIAWSSQSSRTTILEEQVLLLKDNDKQVAQQIEKLKENDNKLLENDHKQNAKTTILEGRVETLESQKKDNKK